MSQQLPSGQTRKNHTVWLSMLVEAMEKFSRPEWLSRPVDRLELAAVRARLAQPATAAPSVSFQSAELM